MRYLFEGLDNQGPHLFPIEPAESATKRWYSNRHDFTVTDFCDQCLETAFDVLHATLSLPVAFGREVDDIPWIVERITIVNQHLARFDFAALASSLVELEVVRKEF